MAEHRLLWIEAVFNGVFHFLISNATIVRELKCLYRESMLRRKTWPLLDRTVWWTGVLLLLVALGVQRSIQKFWKLHSSKDRRMALAWNDIEFWTANTVSYSVNFSCLIMTQEGFATIGVEYYPDDSNDSWEPWVLSIQEKVVVIWTIPYKFPEGYPYDNQEFLKM